MHNVIISCEHASNFVPANLPIKISAQVLKSHRAWDIGAKEISVLLAKKLNIKQVPLSKVSRLCIDYNRSLHHPRVFSSYSKTLAPKQKQLLIQGYKAYRDQIQSLIKRNKLNLHLSIHSFTPKLAGEVRNAEVGILYDPKVPREKLAAQIIVEEFRAQGFKTRKNYPYKGTSDGLCTSLRKTTDNYLGFEIEINQSIAHKKRAEIVSALVQSVQKLQLKLA